MADHELTRLRAWCAMLEAGPALIPGKHLTRKETYPESGQPK